MVRWWAPKPLVMRDPRPMRFLCLRHVSFMAACRVILHEKSNTFLISNDYLENGKKNFLEIKRESTLHDVIACRSSHNIWRVRIPSLVSAKVLPNLCMAFHTIKRRKLIQFSHPLFGISSKFWSYFHDKNRVMHVSWCLFHARKKNELYHLRKISWRLLGFEFSLLLLVADSRWKKRMDSLT